MPNRAGALAFKAAEQIVEFERTGKQAQELLSDGTVFQTHDGLEEKAQTQKLAVIEEVSPRVVVVASRLISVVASAHRKGWEQDVFCPEPLCSF